MPDSAPAKVKTPVATVKVPRSPIAAVYGAGFRRRRGETAIGYRRRPDEADDGRNMGGVVVNPPKSERLSYEPEDRVIVLAED